MKSRSRMPDLVIEHHGPKACAANLRSLYARLADHINHGAQHWAARKEAHTVVGEGANCSCPASSISPTADRSTTQTLPWQFRLTSFHRATSSKACAPESSPLRVNTNPMPRRSSMSMCSILLADARSWPFASFVNAFYRISSKILNHEDEAAIRCTRDIGFPRAFLDAINFCRTEPSPASKT